MIAKTGCGSVAGEHKNRSYIKREDWEKHLNSEVVMIYRDPVERFFSAFVHYFIVDNEKYRLGKPWLIENGFPEDNMDSSDLVMVKKKFSFVMDNLHKLDSEMEVHHWHSITDSCDFDAFPNTRVIRQSQIEEVLHCPKIINQSTYPKDGKKIYRHKDIMTSSQIERVKKIYEKDYEILKKIT